MALEHPLRRDLLECCSTANEKIFDIHEVADEVANVREAAGDPMDTEEILTQLHHQHLPFLADVGVIGFDPQGRQFRYERDELLERLLQRIRSEEQE